MTITINNQVLFDKLTYSTNGRVTRAQIEAFDPDAADLFADLEYWWDYHWAGNPASTATAPYTAADGDTINVTLYAYYDPMFYMPTIHLTMGGEAAISEVRTLQAIKQGRVWRSYFLEESSGGMNPFNFMCRGQALCFAITGEEEFRTVVRNQADYMAGPPGHQTPLYDPNGYWYENLTVVPAFPTWGVNDRFELREMHRLGEVLMYAHLIGATSAYGHNYLTLTQNWLEYALARQHPDGSFRDHSVMPKIGTGDTPSDYNLDSHTWGMRTFYMGFYCFTLCEYYILINQDPRIITAVQNCMNYIWNDPDNYTLYRASGFAGENSPPIFPGTAAEHGLAYISFSGGQPGGYEVRSPANAVTNDLNGYHLLNHAFLYKYTGNATWKTRFLNLVRGQRWAYWWGSSQGFGKQMHQQFSYAPLAWPMIMDASANPKKIRGKWR